MNGYSLHHYFENKGRDEAIDYYIKQKNSLKHRFEKASVKLDIKRIEKDLNAFFYPNPNDPIGIKKANDLLNGVLTQEMDFSANEAVQTGLDSIPALTGKAAITKTSVGKKLLEGKSSSKKGLNYFKDLMEEIDKFRIKSINRYYAMGNSSEAISLDNDWQDLKNIFNDAYNSYLYEVAPDKKIAKNPFIYDIVRLPYTAKNFDIFFTVANQILSNLGFIDFDPVQYGEFFEHALKLFFEKNLTKIIELDGQQVIKKSIIDSSWGGKTPVRMAGTPLPVYMKISASEKKDAENFLENVVKKENIHNINTDIKIITQKKLNESLSQKADVTLTLDSNRKIGVSAKNWSSLYSSKSKLPVQKQSGTIDAQIINGIYHTFRTKTTIYDFLHMLQDVNEENYGEPPGRYSGKQAVSYAKELAIIGTGISALMGLSQGRGHSANLFIVNNRSRREIYVADISDMIRKAFFNESGRNRTRYSIRCENANFLDSLAQEAYSLVNHYGMPKGIYNSIMISKIHEEKLYFSLRVSGLN